jgi:GTP 3',8-cyclase
MLTLHDSFQRRFSYLRLSVTDVCNFKCIYCLPNGYTKSKHKQEPLSLQEIQNLVHGFAKLGFTKVRITGGEPTIRKDILEIISIVTNTPGISQVALSTNGYRLEEMAGDLQKAGVSKINISIDSLNAERFEKITGKTNLKKIIAGINCALLLKYQAVKINAVLLKERAEQDVDDFIAFTKNLPITVRFIELMQTGSNLPLFHKSHVSADFIKTKLINARWKILPRELDAGPALEFDHPDYQGRIGIIAPYSKDFCSTCNRLRITSQGGLKLCLFGDKDYDLRPMLQQKKQLHDLIERIQNLIIYKSSSHFLQNGNYGNTSHFARIGG